MKMSDQTLQAKPVIIWVEDQQDTVGGLIMIARRLGYKVELVATAHDFKTALEQYADRILLIIIDIMLQGMTNLRVLGFPEADMKTGFSAGKRLVEYLIDKQHDFWSIPVIIVSARDQDEVSVEWLKKFNIDRSSHRQVQYIDKTGRHIKDVFTEIVTDIARHKEEK